MQIGFIGFGEAARAFQESLASRDASLSFSAYDILLDAEGAEGPCARAMRDRDVAIVFPPQAGLGRADWVISAVTADQSLVAAEAASRYLRPGQIFLDINSVSPERKRQSAALLGAIGVLYVDMAVMAPVHPRGHGTPTLLAGEVDDALARQLAGLGFVFRIVGREPGGATAIKMVRSLFVKGLEAITVETLLAASASGCLDDVLKSLADTYPGLGWPDFADYQFERSLKHGRRRAAEMRESAATIEALHLHAPLAHAIADVHDRMGALAQDSLSGRGLSTELSRLLAERQGRPPVR